MIAGLVEFKGGPVDARLAARTFRGRPLVDPDADCAIAFDGRIDNASNVAAWLGADRSLAGAALVLAGYATRGVDLFARLSGDFAFAIWDGRARALRLVRDPLGVKQVSFAWSRDGFAFATDARQLLDLPGVDCRPNLGFFGEWMAGWITHPSETIYSGIHRVPPAHLVTVSARGIERRRYWDVDPDRRLCYRDAGEYGARFRELFAASVAARLRGRTRVGIALSGGVDSSAIAAMASSVAPGGTDIRAYNISYPGLGEADEHRYAQLAAGGHHVPLATVRFAGAEPDAYLRAPRLLRDMAPGGVGTADVQLYELMADEGCELVLDGTGADEWFSGSPYHAADLIRHGRLLRALRRLREQALHACSMHDLLTIAKGPLWALCPPSLRRAVKQVAPSRDIVPRLFRRDFARSVNLAGRIAQPNYDDRFASFAAGAVYRDATTQLNAYNWHEDVRLAAAFGMEMSAPFQDRALAEFAVALPEEQRWSNGRAKVVVRSGLADLIPEAILRRDDKGNGSEAQYVELCRLHSAGAFDNLRLVDAGIVERAAVEPMFGSMRALFASRHREYEICASQLWLLFCAESAWRALFTKEATTWSRNAPAPIGARTREAAV
jgi:asparagine synthase (glutamine-hydrolysing)